MVTDVRTRLFTIMGIITGLLLALLLFIGVIRNRGVEAPAGGTQTETPLPPQTGAAPLPFVAGVVPTEKISSDPEDVYLKQLSRILVERFGSYSNQNDNRHIADVLPLATEKMQAYLQSQGQAFGAAYSGTSTKVVASRIEERSADRATVVVDVQRVVRKDGAERTEYQSGIVALLKRGNDWKVDGLFWK